MIYDHTEKTASEGDFERHLAKTLRQFVGSKLEAIEILDDGNQQLAVLSFEGVAIRLALGPHVVKDDDGNFLGVAMKIGTGFTLDHGGQRPSNN